MPIVACLIARGNVVLAEYSPGTNFATIARRLIEQIPTTPDSKKSYSHDSFHFHYLVEGGITYLCMTDQNMNFRVPYAFLFDLNSRFKGTYAEKIFSAGPMGMNDSFSRVIKERLEFFSNERNVDKISKVRGEIEDAKNIMVNNIEKVLERGEKIEVLVDKTEDLNQQSASFKSRGQKLKRKMWWKNAKLCCILICIVVVILAVIICAALWYTGVFKNIFEKSSSSGDTSSSSTTTATATTEYSSTTASSTTAHATTTGQSPTASSINRIFWKRWQ